MRVYRKCLSCANFKDHYVQQFKNESEYFRAHGCTHLRCFTGNGPDLSFQFFKQATPDKLTDNILFRLTTGDVRWV